MGTIEEFRCLYFLSMKKLLGLNDIYKQSKYDLVNKVVKSRDFEV